jgi:hypothetical protein
MYRAIKTVYSGDTTNCYKELGEAVIGDANKKSIESLLKKECDSIRTIIDAIRERYPSLPPLNY